MKGARKNSVKPLPRYVLTNTKTPSEMRRIDHILQTTKNNKNVRSFALYTILQLVLENGELNKSKLKYDLDELFKQQPFFDSAPI